MFSKASKQSQKIKLGISGASGSGKTFTALNIATNLELPVALIDTENGSANLYADLFTFDIAILQDYSIPKLIQSINYAVESGYKTLIIDSFSKSWYWELEQVDKEKTSFLGWAKVRPLERQLLDRIQQANIHIIATMRSRTEYAMEKNNKGKIEPRKVGTTPVQTANIDYEFDLFAELNHQHELRFTKSRCIELSDRVFSEPGKQIADVLRQWVNIETEKVVPFKSNSPVREIPPLVSIGESPEELKQTTNNQPWKDWKSEDDAIAYAMNELPEVKMNRITQEWNKLVPEVRKDPKTGKTRYVKGRAWVKRIEELKTIPF